jgi:hypothetical protein
VLLLRCVSISYVCVESRDTDPSFDQENAEDPEYTASCCYLDASALLYMHCLDELHSQLFSLALTFCYILVPCFTNLGTSYRPQIVPYTDYPYFCCLIMDGILGLD